MIVDTSALMAILLGEPEQQAFTLALRKAGDCKLSAGSWIELAAVITRRLPAWGDELDRLVQRRSVTDLDHGRGADHALVGGRFVWGVMANMTAAQESARSSLCLRNAEQTDGDGVGIHLAAPLQFESIVCKDSNSAALTVSHRDHATGSIRAWMDCSTICLRSLGSSASISQQRTPCRSTNH